MSRDGRTVGELAAVAGVTLAAFAVRAGTATWTGLTTDEANGVALALTGSWGDMLLHLEEDGNPPLFYALIRLYAALFGQSDVALKLFAIVLATLVVPLSYAVCRRFLQHELALQAALLLALCPPLVRYSTMVRGYALMPLFSLLSTWAMMRVLARPRDKLWIAVYGLITATMVYCHYWGAFVALGQTTLVLFGLIRGWYGRRQARGWLAGAAVALLLFLPWVPSFSFQITHNLSPWAQPPWPSYMVTGLLSALLVGPEWSIHAFEQASIAFTSLVMWFVVLCPRVLVVPDPANPEKQDGEPLFDGGRWKIVAVAGLAIAVLVSYVKPVLRDRYLTPFAPLFLLVYATGIRAILPKSWPALARFSVPVLIWLPVWIPQYRKMMLLPETGTPAIVREIKQKSVPGKDMVLVSWQSIAPAITFYMPDDLEVITFPDLERTRFNKWAGMSERLRDPARLESLFKQLDKVLESGGTVWLVDRARDVMAIDPARHDLLFGAPFMEADMRRMDQIRNWLRTHATQVGSNKMAPGRDFHVFLSVWRRSAGPSETEPQEGAEEYYRAPGGWR